MKNCAKILQIGLLVASLIIGAAVPIVADSFLKQVATTAPFEVMGEIQPAASDTSVTWMTRDCVYNRSKEGVTISRFDRGLIYTLDLNQKTYTELPMAALTDMSALMEEIAGDDAEVMAMLEELRETGTTGELEEARETLEDNPEMARLLETMLQMLTGVTDGSEQMITVNVKPTEEYRNFGEWRSRKYLVDMSMPMVDGMISEVWATDQIDIEYDQLMQTTLGMAASWPGFAEAMKEFGKIKGMAVQSTVAMNMMGFDMKITSELIEYRESDPPAGIYDIPEDYTKVEFGAWQNE